MISTTSCSDWQAGNAVWRMDWERTCMETLEHLVLETLADAGGHLEFHFQHPDDRRSLSAALESMRQVRGALSMLGFDQGVDLLTAAEALTAALLDGRVVADHARRTLRSALSDLQTCLNPDQRAPGGPPDLSQAAEALRDCCGSVFDGTDADPYPQVGRGDADDGDDHVGEWVPNGQPGGDVLPETGLCIAQIKSQLKTVVEIMPHWWEDLRAEQHLTTLARSFAQIAERAETLNLGEIAKLAALLERLVARVNDEMISVTVQMMYGVIEQGVLKLGILFLQYCRPQGSPEDAAARQRLERALAGMQLLTSRVDSGAAGGGAVAVPSGVDDGAPALRQLTFDGADRDRPGDWSVGSFGHRRLEDLFVEANLLHAQLMPRMQMMREQQCELQRGLAGLQGVSSTEVTTADGEWTWHTDESPELSGKVAAMLSASRLLARLITECEECLQNYRRATHELQGVILGGVSDRLQSSPSSRA